MAYGISENWVDIDGYRFAFDSEPEIVQLLQYIFTDKPPFNNLNASEKKSLIKQLQSRLQ